MISSNQFEAAAHPASTKFEEHLHALRSQCRSFAACVRLEYQKIERAVDEGISLESIVLALSESYGVQGSLAALKSALSRIRRARDGQDCQQWLDRNASLTSHPSGVPDGLVAGVPAMNPHTQPWLSFQPNVPFQETVQQQFPGAGPAMLAGGAFQSPPQHPHWPASFPWHGQAPLWQPSPAGHNPYGGNSQSKF